MPKRSFSEKEKVELVLASMKDGVVVTDFCTQHKISRSTFYSWKKALINYLAKGVTRGKPLQHV